MAERRDGMRAADADRQFVAERLRGALDEGRLSLGEYDERLQQAYAAKTYGELDTVLADLPGVAPAGNSQLARAEAAAGTAVNPPNVNRRFPPWLLAVWGSWLTTSLIVTVIWFATSVSSGGDAPFWPIWVIGPWGAVLLGRTIIGLANGGQDGYAQYRAQRLNERAGRRQDRWERRQDRRFP